MLGEQRPEHGDGRLGSLAGRGPHVEDAARGRIPHHEDHGVAPVDRPLGLGPVEGPDGAGASPATGLEGLSSVAPGRALALPDGLPQGGDRGPGKLGSQTLEPEARRRFKELVEGDDLIGFKLQSRPSAGAWSRHGARPAAEASGREPQSCRRLADASEATREPSGDTGHAASHRAFPLAGLQLSRKSELAPGRLPRLRGRDSGALDRL